MGIVNSLNFLYQNGWETVYYSQNLKDNSVYGMAENLASQCKTPIRWLKTEFYGENKTYTISNYNDEGVNITEETSFAASGIRKILRIVVGIFGAILVSPFAIPLMGFAFRNEEIRLKYSIHMQIITNIDPNTKDLKRQVELISARQELVRNAKDCEPVSCCLSSICSLLFYMACCKETQR